MVGPSGLEPPTSCLSGTRSNHLSYEPLSGAAPKPGFAFIFSFRSSCARNCCLLFGSFASACLSGGGDDGIRTHDPLLAGQVLSQLSYTPIFMGLLLFSPKDPSKLNNESIYSDKTVILCRIHIVMYGRFSIERR